MEELYPSQPYGCDFPYAYTHLIRPDFLVSEGNSNYSCRWKIKDNVTLDVLHGVQILQIFKR